VNLLLTEPSCILLYLIDILSKSRLLLHLHSVAFVISDRNWLASNDAPLEWLTATHNSRMSQVHRSVSADTIHHIYINKRFSVYFIDVRAFRVANQPHMQQY
jgi:hypothetical protein